MGTWLRYALLPAAAITVAVIAQPLVTALVPAAQRFDIGGLSAGSYIPIVVSSVLCFGIGYWSGKRARSRQIVGAAGIVPLGALLAGWAIARVGQSTSGSRPA